MATPASPARKTLRAIGLRLVPLVAFALSLAVLRLAQELRLVHGWPFLPLTPAAFALVLLGDLALARWFDRRHPRLPPSALRIPRLAAQVLALAPVVGRAMVWAAAFWFLVEDPARIGDPLAFRSWQGQARFVWSWMVLALFMSPPLTIVAGAVWLALYEFLVARRRMLRGIVFLVAGPGLVWLMVNSYYHQWGAPDVSQRIESQPGVRLLFNARGVRDGHLRRPWTYPRDLLVDEAARRAYVSLGATLGTSGSEAANLWQVDLDTGETRTLESRQVRVLASDPDGPYLYAFPWYTHEILKIDKATFAVVARIDIREAFPAYSVQPTAVVIRAPYAYISMCYIPVVLRLDLRSDRITEVLDLREDGLLETGSLCCHFADDPGHDRIVFTANRSDGSILGTLDTGRFRVAATTTLPVDARWVVRSGAGERRGVFAIDDFDGRVVEFGEDDLAIRSECRTVRRSILGIDQASQRLLVLDPLKGVLTFQTFDCQVEREVYVGPKPYGLQAGKAGVYVVSAAGLVLVDRVPASP